MVTLAAQFTTEMTNPRKIFFCQLCLIEQITKVSHIILTSHIQVKTLFFGFA